MKALYAPVAVHSPPREQIYGALLTDPERDWRVSQLTEQVPDVSVKDVRTILYLLLGERLVEAVAHQRNLTLRLTDAGRATVEQITARWQRSPKTGEGAE
ncbi:hypothetical protein [Micromonospora sp. NPDC005220]|uniref:hypothetical protein n=1 Tax=Micromonospora sp. NPDC005220 TaxID=3155589 RepID=UPI0033B9EF49